MRPGHLGDKANVSSISPPDQSAQAGHCARFYPIARDALQEMHTWGFCTRRVALALSASDPPSTWQYAYIAPSGVLNYLTIRDPYATDDWADSGRRAEAIVATEGKTVCMVSVVWPAGSSSKVIVTTIFSPPGTSKPLL